MVIMELLLEALVLEVKEIIQEQIQLEAQVALSLLYRVPMLGEVGLVVIT